MSKGKKTDNETIYKIMISMFSTNNFSETGRQLGIPQRTVEKIYKENKNKQEFTKLCEEKKDEFAKKASRIIDKALNRLEKVLDDEEEKIPVNNLSTVIGTLYDKRNLAEGKSTVNTELNIRMDEKVEELSR
nr:MAG TPA: Hydrogen peroxide-inducible genes activator [Caudoviricetes sp.]